MNRYIFTCGDPNGIGPEITIKALNAVYNSKDEFVLIIPKNVFLENASLVKPNFRYRFYSAKTFIPNSGDHVKIISIKNGRIAKGKPTKLSGAISFNALELANEIIDEPNCSAIITAPISKTAWELNSIKYEGHTDYFGALYNIKNPLMLFYSKKLIAALTTIHIPVKDISKSITKVKLKSVIDSLDYSLKRDFQINKPIIAVLGLNPHSGEEGRIGKEELKVIKPVIKQFGKSVNGPFVPDAFFGMKQYKNYDAVLGMYHDQVLIPFKMLDFDKGVNITANLPIVRTSPDHGTAFDIAYKGIANSGSMIEAYKLAKRVVNNRQSK